MEARRPKVARLWGPCGRETNCFFLTGFEAVAQARYGPRVISTMIAKGYVSVTAVGTFSNPQRLLVVGFTFGGLIHLLSKQ